MVIADRAKSLSSLNYGAVRALCVLWLYGCYGSMVAMVTKDTEVSASDNGTVQPRAGILLKIILRPYLQ